MNENEELEKEEASANAVNDAVQAMQRVFPQFIKDIKVNHPYVNMTYDELEAFVFRNGTKITPNENNLLVKLISWNTKSLSILSGKDEGIEFTTILCIAAGDYCKVPYVNKRVVLSNAFFLKGSSAFQLYSVSSSINKEDAANIKKELQTLKNSEYQDYIKASPYTTIVQYVLVPMHEIAGYFEE
jgi:hypothetical protein